MSMRIPTPPAKINIKPPMAKKGSNLLQNPFVFFVVASTMIVSISWTEDDNKFVNVHILAK